MIDSFLFLTPFLVLGIIALLGFVGCDLVFGLQHVPDPVPVPTGLNPTPGDGQVQCSWDTYDKATQYHLHRGLDAGNYTISFDIDAPTTTYTDSPLINGTPYHYALSQTTPDGLSSLSEDLVATPEPPPPTFTPFVTSFALGTFQNQLSGWAGMVIQVGPNPIQVKMLGRMIGTGNTQTHNLKIYDPAASADVATATIDASTGIAGRFLYATLATPVTLNAGFTYYVVTEELIGGDHFYIDDTTVQTTGVATVTSAVTGSSMNIFTPTNTAGHTFGPVDFQY